MTTRRALRYAVPPLVFAAMVMAYCWRIWTPISGAGRAFSWDALWSYWGDISFQIHAVERGELPLWNPFDRAGFPYIADPQPGTLYPFTWPLVALGLVTGTVWWLVAVKVMFHLWLWGLGMYVWLRRRNLPVAACYMAGAFGMLAYPVSDGLHSALNWGMAWTPWVLLAIDVFAEKPGIRSAAALALALAMCDLAGAPASFWYTLLVAIPYGAWALRHHRPPPRKVLYMGAAGAALFLAMVAGQTLATSALVFHTVRSVRDLDFIAFSALSSDNLFGLLVPRMPGINAYLGMVYVFCALAALSLKPSGRTFTLAAIVVGGTLLALGSHGGWLPNLASVVPLAGLFRRAHRYAFVLHVPFAALAAEGLAALHALDDEQRRRRVGWLLLALGLVGAVIFGCGIVSTVKQPPRAAYHDAFVIAFFAWALGAWALRQLVVAARWREVLLAFCAVLAIFDLWFGHYQKIEANFWKAPSTANNAEVLALPGVPLEKRIYDRDHLKYRAGTRLQIRDLGGYEDDPLALRRYANLLHVAQADARALGHANVGYALGTGGAKKVRYPSDFTTVRPGIWKVPVVAPEVAWYPGAEIVADAAEALDVLRATVPGTNAVLERDALAGARVPPPDPARAPVAGRLIHLGLKDVIAEVDAPAEGVVVILENYHPGWRATVDGQPVRVLPANAAFRGVVVGPGHHRIEMHFTLPMSTAALLWLSPLAVLAAAISAAGGDRIRWTRRRPT